MALPMALVAVAATWRMEFGEFVLRGTLLGVLFAAVLVIVVTCGERTTLKRAFDSGGMRFLGKYSYAAYVLHPLVLTVVLRRLTHERLSAMTHSGRCTRSVSLSSVTRWRAPAVSTV